MIESKKEIVDQNKRKKEKGKDFIYLWFIESDINDVSYFK
jgi:hypothetical protein